jgi:hypothetical protein
LAAGDTHSHTVLPCAEFFYHDGNSQQNTDFEPDMLPDKGKYTG